MLGCREPPTGSPSSTPDAQLRANVGRSTVFIEVRVVSEEVLLEQAVDATTRLGLQLQPGIGVTDGAGDWRLEIVAARDESAGAAAVGAVRMSVRLVDGSRAHHELRDAHGNTVDSAVGGTVKCTVSNLSSAIAGVVADVGKFAAWDKRFSERLRAGETDLVDVDAVRDGAR
jgi:hypothetical protein